MWCVLLRLTFPIRKFLIIACSVFAAAAVPSDGHADGSSAHGADHKLEPGILGGIIIGYFELCALLYSNVQR